MEILTVQQFAGAMNQGFDLCLGESTMALTLTEVTPLPHQPYKGMFRAPFSLIFRSRVALILPQRIYTLSNATLGRHDIFLVPIGKDAVGVLYQAIFN